MRGEEVDKERGKIEENRRRREKKERGMGKRRAEIRERGGFYKNKISLNIQSNLSN